MIKQPRQLDASEIDTVLALGVPAHLATMDRDGYPHVTPLWFVWEDGAFYMTSIADRPHLKRLSHNARAGLCIDIEAAERNRPSLTAPPTTASSSDYDRPNSSPSPVCNRRPTPRRPTFFDGDPPTFFGGS